MEIYQLRTFVAVAEEGNLTRASERLFTSQPAVSAQIKALEEECGVKLFDRTPRGMTLTPEGQTLKLSAEAVLQAARGFIATADSLQHELLGEVKIGVNTDGEFLRISRVLRGIKQAHPKLKLQFIQDISGKIIKSLLSEEYDCGFFFGDSPTVELATEKLADFNVYVCGGFEWKSRIENASWEELVKLPWIYPIPDCPYRQVLNRLFDLYGSEPSDTVQSSSEETMNALVRSGSGISLMREDDALKGEACGEVAIWKGGRYSLPLNFAWHRNREDDPLLRAVRDSICASWCEPQVAKLDVITGGKK